jgi:hypothetical protein
MDEDTTSSYCRLKGGIPMLSEADLIAKRTALWWLTQQHPQWSHQDLADALAMSRSWVSKWLQRLRQTDPDDVMALHSRSCARHTPPVSIASQPAVVQRILEIRVAPPENLQRIPGPEAILYYLSRDPELQQRTQALPRSTRTIWKILRRNDRISQKKQRKHQPLQRPLPLEEVQMDFKDVSSVPAHPSGKQQHVVEVFNFVDAGTSILLEAQVQADFHAQTTLEAVIHFLQRYGVPPKMTFDRDPRFVRGATGRDFPSPLVRLLLCLGIQPNICPPHRPDKNAFVMV